MSTTTIPTARLVDICDDGVTFAADTGAILRFDHRNAPTGRTLFLTPAPAPVAAAWDDPDAPF